MKTKKVNTVMLILALTAVLAGCAKDASTPPDPGTARDAILGNYSVSEIYTRLNYEATVIADPSSTNGVLISGFAGTLPTDPYAGALVTGTKITLDSNQVIGDGLKINGSGTISGQTINWNYTIDDGATKRNAVAIYTKK